MEWMCAFPGIYLTYNEVNARHDAVKQNCCDDYLEIVYCKEGRMEYVCNKSFYYLSPGDVAICRKSAVVQEAFFPSGHYGGLTILVDASCAPIGLSSATYDLELRLGGLVEKLCCTAGCVLMHADEEMSLVLSRLCEAQTNEADFYARIKLLELFYLLDCLSVDKTDNAELLVPKNQVSLAKRVNTYIQAHRDEHITIEELARKFAVSPTLLKKSFRAVYGDSLYAFSRAQKMKEAAMMLEQNDKTVTEIASTFGYDNSSKFAKAFKQVMGEAPQAYRQSKKV